MKWSWKIGTIAGIDVRIHTTFVLLPGWVCISNRMPGIRRLDRARIPQELTATQMGAAVSGTPLSDVIVTDFRELKPGDTPAHGVRLLLQGSQQDFPVVEQDRVVGIVTRSDVFAALAKHGSQYTVEAAMRRDFLAVGYGKLLETVRPRLQEFDCHSMPVLHALVILKGRLVGLLKMENLGEYFIIQAALRPFVSN